MDSAQNANTRTRPFDRRRRRTRLPPRLSRDIPTVRYCVVSSRSIGPSLGPRRSRRTSRATEPANTTFGRGLPTTLSVTGRLERQRKPSSVRRRASAERRIRAAARPRGEAIASRPNASSVRKHPSQSGPTRKLDRQRVRRWQQRHTTSRLDDQPPGGSPIHCILEWESAAVIELFEEVWQGRSVASQARSPLLVSGTRVGLTVHG
jgi:hypothetical protein